MLDVKLTVVPAQMLFVLALIAMVGVTVGFTVMATTLLVMLLVAKHAAFEIKTHEI